MAYCNSWGNRPRSGGSYVQHQEVVAELGAGQWVIKYPAQRGRVELRPNIEDGQVAHRIWVELVTRKAALPIDPDLDVIVEVYDSWYALFGRVRQLIGDIPSRLVRKEESTRKLIKIATDTLNLGLRPHLTQWQAPLCSS